MIKKLLFIISTVAIVFACTPSECFKSIGTIQKVKKDIGYFQHIRVEDNVSVMFVEGNEVFLEAGENLLPNINFELRSDSTLIISNKSSCDWLRRYDVPITVYVGIEHINYVYWHSSGNIQSSPFLKKTYLQLDIFDVNALVDLSVDMLGLYVFCNSGADIKLKGMSQDLSVYMKGYGKVDASNLQAQRVKVKHQGANDVIISPIEILEATIEGFGNILYTQEPSQKDITITGSGKVHKL